ncbi:MAG: hypothetical protein GX443_19020 [Deltaproteobacteria bacterium]|nr:hypothetical protein [Deltaproteobacteria bacterium]
MKKQRKEGIGKIEETLIRFHRNRPVPEVSEHWRHKVMAHILEQSPPKVREQENGMKVGSAAWRLAAVSLVMTLFLAAFLVDGGASNPYDLVDGILWETSGYDLGQVFGVL